MYTVHASKKQRKNLLYLSYDIFILEKKNTPECKMIKIQSGQE